MKDTGPNRDRKKQTPGPWTAWFNQLDSLWRIDHKLPDNSIIVGFAADEGDARLIAAAPELLEALERIASLHERQPFTEIPDLARGIAERAITLCRPTP